MSFLFGSNSKINSSNLDRSASSVKRPLFHKRQQDVKPFSSNNTLLYYQGANKPHYYLTAYVRVRVISISGISYQEMSANLNCQFYIDISYRRLKKSEKNQMLQQGIRISFEADESLLLSRDNADVSVFDNEGEKRISYVVRKFVQTKILCDDLFWSPFQVIKCQIGLKINKLKLVCQNEKTPIQKISETTKLEQQMRQNMQFVPQEKSRYFKNFKPLQDDSEEYTIFVHFNMMDHEKQNFKVKTSLDSNFGLFQIASSLLNASYSTNYNMLANTVEVKESNREMLRRFFKRGDGKDVRKVASQNATNQLLPLIKRKYGKQRLSEFNVALFDIPLYKKPVVANLTIFLPLLVLAIINLGIFYEEPDLHKRIVSIAAIMVSFVALIPTIRQQIPPTPTITLVQILVFSEAITTILVLFDSLRVLNVDPNGWNFDGLQSALFILSLAITILVNLIIAILSLCFICKWKPSYVDQKALQLQEYKQQQRLNIYEWGNKEADIYFNQFYTSDSIQVLEDMEEKKVVLIGNIFDVANQKQEEKYKEDVEEIRERSESSEIFSRMR